MIRLGGLPFEVVPAERLSPAETHALARLPSVDETPGRRAFGDRASVSPLPDVPGPGPRAAPPLAPPRPFVLELLEGAVDDGVGEAVPRDERAERARDDAPAAVDWDGARVTIRHRRLAADLDPLRGTGRLRRDASVGWPLEVTLRTALAARLPLEGGLPLHAAGVVEEGKGVVFFGPSGAGKSTLAAASPHPVVSDEMVAIVPEGPGTWALASTGFWGTFDNGGAGAAARPLTALVALEKGPSAQASLLEPRAALRRLVGSTLVPPGPPLWSAALGTIGRLVRTVPTLRLAWNPDEPWEAIAQALRRAGAMSASPRPDSA